MKKVTKNEYVEIMKKLANRVWETDETKITYAEYEKMLDEYDVLPFVLSCDEKSQKIINTYCETEEDRKNSKLYRGSIDHNRFYELFAGLENMYNDYYQTIVKDVNNKIIYTYCEGDFIAEVFENEKLFNEGLKDTEKFIKEM